MNKALFIYAISTLYAMQAGLYWWHREWAAGFLAFMYALAGIPLIFMTK